ncbi:MAG: hypothetical protein KC635_00905 [Myxococcales bacterium]|nr:hypothetical protein [Myxococcales bacterium]
MSARHDDPPQTPRWRALLAAFAARVGEHGFDLCAAGSVAWYQRRVAAEHALPDLGRDDALVIVVGNSRALWERFTAAYRGSESLRATRDPLDTWTADVVTTAAREALGDVRWEVRYPWEAPPRRVAFQRLADAVGLAQLGPVYCVHAEHGPWIALRAALVVDVPGPEALGPVERPCEGCAERPCEPALREATAAAQEAADLRPWLRVRDACPRGRDSRYGDDQIRYHYTRDRGALDLP